MEKWVMAENTIWPFDEVTHNNAGAGPFQSKQAFKTAANSSRQQFPSVKAIIDTSYP